MNEVKQSSQTRRAFLTTCLKALAVAIPTVGLTMGSTAEARERHHRGYDRDRWDRDRCDNRRYDHDRWERQRYDRDRCERERWERDWRERERCDRGRRERGRGGVIIKIPF